MLHPTKFAPLSQSQYIDQGSISAWKEDYPWLFDLDFKLWLSIFTSIEWTSKPNHLDFILDVTKNRFFSEEKIGCDTPVNLIKVSQQTAKCVYKLYFSISVLQLLSGIQYGYGTTDAVQKYEGVKYLYLFDYRYGDTDGQPFLGLLVMKHTITAHARMK